MEGLVYDYISITCMYIIVHSQFLPGMNERAPIRFNGEATINIIELDSGTYSYEYIIHTGQ